jgi:hypothetical protein
MIKKITDTIPGFLQPFLWSYDISRLDGEKNKTIIIKNILDFGSTQATEWLRHHYTENEICQTICQSIRSDWSKKSINLWIQIYGVNPKETRLE